MDRTAMMQPNRQDETAGSRDDPFRERPRAVARWRALVVTGIVTPYTHALYETIVARHGIDLHVVACSPLEPNRLWRLPEARTYRRRTLHGLRWHRGYVRHVYLNPGMVREIVRLRPDVTVVCDFSPTMMLAAATAKLSGVPVALSSDTHLLSDPGSSSLPHRLARRLMARLTSAAIGGSSATLDFFAQYGIGGEHTVVCPVIPAWRHEGPAPARDERPYDLLFCGLLDDRVKGALHFLQIVASLVARGRQPTIRIVGDGPLSARMRHELSDYGLRVRFDGYLQQPELAEAYLSSKLLLFPSRGDTWGLVANEAAQCGTPVLISPHAQAAFGLVQRFGCGAVLPMDVAAWADAVEHHLDDGETWMRASAAGLASRRHFSLETAADSFVSGMEMAREADTRGHSRADAHG